MKKTTKTVGIITMHRVLNFGSVLQAYALQQAVGDLGYYSEIINYQFPNEEHVMYLKNKSHSSIHVSLRTRLFHAIKRRLRSSKPSADDIRREKFSQFMVDNLKLSDKFYENRYQIDKEIPCYDIYLTGSDQVWNPSYVGYDTTFMCGFVRNGNPCISFAASMAVPSIPDQFIKYYKTELSKYDFISVREKTAMNIIRNLTGKTTTLVCDPTMLLTKEQWMTKLNIESCEKYFIIYILDYTYNPYPQIFDIIEKCHKRYGGQIIVLHGKISDYMKQNGAIVVDTASPSEFIRYFSNASFVITSSFHGTIFSLNFRVPFISVVDNRVGRDSRVNDLLSMLGADCFKQIYSEPLDLNRDYYYTPEILSKIEQFRTDSLLYLQKSLDHVVKKN